MVGMGIEGALPRGSNVAAEANARPTMPRGRDA
jgi:hypothetical protein